LLKSSQKSSQKVVQKLSKSCTKAVQKMQKIKILKLVGEEEGEEGEGDL
jgi:hypothetical protein